MVRFNFFNSNVLELTPHLGRILQFTNLNMTSDWKGPPRFAVHVAHDVVDPSGVFIGRIRFEEVVQIDKSAFSPKKLVCLCSMGCVDEYKDQGGSDRNPT